MILATGAGGYIGSVLVPMLLNRGHRVRVVDRFYFGCHLPTDHPRLEILETDVRCLVTEHFADVTAVVDLAGVSLDPTGQMLTNATMDINHQARARTATLAKQAKVLRYIVTASCSVYGWQPPEVICDETSPTNPTSIYGRSNLLAEQDTLKLADEHFCATAIRQATVFGLSPRMRFDIAINRMTLQAYETGRLPLMRDGSQWRTWVHVQDTAAAICHLLDTDAGRINGQVYNVGSAACTVQLQAVAALVARVVPREVEIELYGDPDTRSYRASFAKIEGLGFRAQHSIEEGVAQICEALDGGAVDRSERTVNLSWYQRLQKESSGIFDIPGRT